MLKIAVCDDNPIQCAQIRDMTVSNLQLPAKITTFTSATDFLEHISEKKSHFHIVLMDIDLGTESLSGITIAEKINLLSPDTQIIFISQHLQYASSVYETNHVYFLCKQQLAEYLPKALTAACRKLRDLQTAICVSVIFLVITAFFVVIFFIWKESFEIQRYTQKISCTSAVKSYQHLWQSCIRIFAFAIKALQLTFRPSIHSAMPESNFLMARISL